MSTRKRRYRSGQSPVKARRTFTLSPASIGLLEELSTRRGKGRQESVSAVLDEVLLAVRDARQRQAMDRATTAYYDGRSPAEEEEERTWAEFALSQFPVDDVDHRDSQ